MVFMERAVVAISGAPRSPAFKRACRGMTPEPVMKIMCDLTGKKSNNANRVSFSNKHWAYHWDKRGAAFIVEFALRDLQRRSVDFLGETENGRRARVCHMDLRILRVQK